MDNTELIKELLAWACEKARPEAKKLAEEYLKKDGTLEDRVDELISHQQLKCGGVGFATSVWGMAGSIALLPVDFSHLIFQQVKMTMAIAYMAGRNLEENDVATICTACLLGKKGVEIIQKAIFEKMEIKATGEAFSRLLVRTIPQEVAIKVNQKVVNSFAANLGGKGIVNVSKMAPLIGGVISGGLNYCETGAVGKAAKYLFILKK